MRFFFLKSVQKRHQATTAAWFEAFCYKVRGSRGQRSDSACFVVGGDKVYNQLNTFFGRLDGPGTTQDHQVPRGTTWDHAVLRGPAWSCVVLLGTTRFRVVPRGPSWYWAWSSIRGPNDQFSIYPSTLWTYIGTGRSSCRLPNVRRVRMSAWRRPPCPQQPVDLICFDRTKARCLFVRRL